MVLIEAVDRPIPPEVERQQRLRRVLKIVVPIVLIAVVIAALPGWMRPAVTRARIRTARVTTGPVEAVITASGTVVPEVERVLSSPLDARVLRILQRPGASLKQGDPVVELDISESVLALDKVVKDLKIKENQQAQTRLTLEKSLVDLDGRLEVKALELQSAQARLEGGSAAVQGRAALARGAAPLGAGGQAGADRAGAAAQRAQERGARHRACSSRGSRSSAARSTRRPRRRAGCSTSRRRSRTATAC